jgi:hypothetical protein
MFAAPTAGVAEYAILPGIIEQQEELENCNFIDNSASIRMPFATSTLMQIRRDRIVSTKYLLLSWRKCFKP